MHPEARRHQDSTLRLAKRSQSFGDEVGGRRWERSFPRFRSRKNFCLRALAIFKQVERLVGPLFERRSVVGGQNQFHCHKDLYDAIERKDFPSWTLKVQVMP